MSIAPVIRWVSVVLGAAAAVGAANAGDTLTIEAGNPNAASLAPGASITAKAGDVIYWEDERTVDQAVLVGAMAVEGSKFWGTDRAVPPDARLRRADVAGQRAYCAEGEATQDRNAGVVCLFDSDNDARFESVRTLNLEKWLSAGTFAVIGRTTKIETPVSYRAEPGYRSAVGFRVVYRFLGVADGRVTIGCKMEPKGPVPAALQAVLDRHPEVLAEVKATAAVPTGATVSISAPLCVSPDLLQEGKQTHAPFKISRLVGNRMLKLDVAAADAKSMTARLVQPLARWSLFYEAIDDRVVFDADQPRRAAED